jgi:hypothetical protein
MTEIDATHVAAVVGAILAKKPVARILGPAFDEVGEGLRRWTAFRVGNVEKVVDKAVRNIERNGTAEGVIAPRVSMQVIEQGSYTDDEIIAEYLGGVLASSVSEDGRDDRGIAYSAQINRLSSPQLRLHFVIYSTLHSALRRGTFGSLSELRRAHLFLPYRELFPAMELDESEDALNRFEHAFYGLHRESLVGESFGYGNADFGLQGLVPQADEPGLAVSPTPSGIELFLWGVGLGHLSVHVFLNGATGLELSNQVDVSRVTDWKIAPTP